MVPLKIIIVSPFLSGRSLSDYIYNKLCVKRSISYRFYIVTYCIKWVTTSWTHSTVSLGSSDLYYIVS